MVQVVALSASTHNVHYVKSDDSSPLSCPGQPCLTLDQYNQQTETYFTTGSTFVFLAGNHTINTTFNLTSISEIILRGERNSQVNILCSSKVVILCENVSISSIEGLVFLSGNTAIGTVALKITDSNRVKINNVGFKGSYFISKPFTGLHITSSDTITVTSCSFEGNTAYNGGAIYVTAESNLTLNASTFIGNNATRHGGAIYASGSNLTLSDNTFRGNTAGNGGAMYVVKSNVTISDTAFTHNRAVRDGGAMYSGDSTVSITGSTKNSSILSSGGYCRTCDMITTTPKSIPYEEVIMELNEAVCATHFTNNTATRYGGAMSIDSSTLLFSGTVIMFMYNLANDSGGALGIRKSNITTNARHIFFNSNRAYRTGGSVAMAFSKFHTAGNIYLLSNSASQGGGIHISHSRSNNIHLIILLSKNTYFIANQAECQSSIKCRYDYLRGGAIYAAGSFNVTGSAIFTENTATYGGAIFTFGTFNISGKIQFVNNTARKGGGLFIHDSFKMSLHLINGVDFINNTAHSVGGGIWLGTYKERLFRDMIWLSGNFFRNKAGKCGGAVYIEKAINEAHFYDISVIANSNGALCISNSRITFSGKVNITNNSGTQGGGITVISKDCLLNFNGNAMFDGNKAELGGAIYSTYDTKLTFSRTIIFSHNTADT